MVYLPELHKLPNRGSGRRIKRFGECQLRTTANTAVVGSGLILSLAANKIKGTNPNNCNGKQVASTVSVNLGRVVSGPSPQLSATAGRAQIAGRFCKEGADTGARLF
ncbi:hypothetical protein H6P81_002741 [Aristolochia fimbriata]|uniref:Uncharacterized protein n=1 Tax=Aristolochia fimbriata TaxID=158543 RepID=A0AAV7FBB1_ARIFI|nr:hypothetical protein H6P81_002741 [Aristolochia fimbriata]